MTTGLTSCSIGPGPAAGRGLEVAIALRFGSVWFPDVMKGSNLLVVNANLGSVCFWTVFFFKGLLSKMKSKSSSVGLSSLSNGSAVWKRWAIGVPSEDSVCWEGVAGWELLASLKSVAIESSRWARLRSSSRWSRFKDGSSRSSLSRFAIWNRWCYWKVSNRSRTEIGNRSFQLLDRSLPVGNALKIRWVKIYSIMKIIACLMRFLRSISYWWPNFQCLDFGLLNLYQELCEKRSFDLVDRSGLL